MMLGGRGAGAARHQHFLLLADDSDDDLGVVPGDLLGLTIVPEPSLASSWVDAGEFPPARVVGSQGIMLGTSSVTLSLMELPSLCLRTPTASTGVEGSFGGGLAPLKGCKRIEGSRG
jgi:hypothetical protein